jgi:hypothetical protein
MHTMKDIAGHDAAQAREARWRQGNPTELAKEVEMMERASVAPYVIAHARAFRQVLLDDYQARYGLKHGGA